MFRYKIDSSYPCPKMRLSVYNKSLPYCLFFGTPLASYLTFFFCFTLFAMFVVLSFWFNFQFLSVKSKGGSLLFCSSVFCLFTMVLSCCICLFLLFNDISFSFCFASVLHNSVSGAAKSIYPFLTGVSLWLVLWRNVSELSAMTNFISTCLFFSAQVSSLVKSLLKFLILSVTASA